MAYSHDGQGLHRSTDPADGEDYVYGHLFLDAAPTVFACFDQPDLKAPYTLTVTAPEEWTVLGNGAATLDRPRAHRPGGHSTAGDVLRDGVRRALGVRAGGARRHTAGRPCRRSWSHTSGSRPSTCSRPPGMLRPLPPAVRHPVPVRGVPPGLRAGVQRRRNGEPGLRHVPRHDGLPGSGDPRRGAPTQQHHRPRDGPHVVRDLVTMHWWDDLWLNESFAEYMAYEALTEVTEFTDAWVESGGDPQDVGILGRVGTQHASGGRLPGSRRPLGARQLRRHLVREGRLRAASSSRTSATTPSCAASRPTCRRTSSERRPRRVPAAMERASGRSPCGLELGLARDGRGGPPDARGGRPPGVLLRRPPERPHNVDGRGFGARPRCRGCTSSSREIARRCPASKRLLAQAIVVPNAGDLTGRRYRSTPARWPTSSSGSPTSRTCRPAPWCGWPCSAASTAPRSTPARPSTFRAAWPHETASAVLARSALVVTS